ncbi:hypothetical protein NKJ95_17000 [Mesorhizobium sp. M0012]
MCRSKVRPASVSTSYSNEYSSASWAIAEVPNGQFGDRGELKTMIEALGAKNAVWLDLEPK